VGLGKEILVVLVPCLLDISVVEEAVGEEVCQVLEWIAGFVAALVLGKGLVLA
jgi:hypothetical protein